MILSLGAVEFDTASGRLGRAFYRVFDSAGVPGFHIDPSTVTWWMRQSDAARSLITEARKVSLSEGLGEFTAYLLGCETIPELWGNGAGFDNVILRTAYQLIGRIPPWEHWNDRCYRTLKALYGKGTTWGEPSTERMVSAGLQLPEGFNMIALEIPHSAIADAVRQASLMLAMYGKPIA